MITFETLSWKKNQWRFQYNDGKRRVARCNIKLKFNFPMPNVLLFTKSHEKKPDESAKEFILLEHESDRLGDVHQQ